MTWLRATALLAVILMATAAQALEIVPGVSGNDQFLKAWAGIGDPNSGLIGPYGMWNDQDAKHVWATGIRGQYDISTPTRAVVGTIFGVPESWWSALDSLGARVYLAGEVGVCRLSDSPEAQTTPLVGARLLVLTAELGYNIFEGGKVRTSGSNIVSSGLVGFVGVSRVFRF